MSNNNKGGLMSGIADIATSGLMSGVSGLVGQGLDYMINGSQYDQQKKLQELQIKGGKEMADYNNKKQMEMWKATNASAQRTEYEKAGLSTSLMYGGGGAGGGTTGSGGGAMPSGDNASSQMMARLTASQMASQIKLTEAQAKKTEVEADKIGGVDTEQIKANTAGTLIDNGIKEIQKYVADYSKYDAIDNIKYSAEKTMKEAASAGVKAAIDEETQIQQMEKIRNESVISMLEVQAKRQGIEIDKARLTEIYERIKQGWESIAVQREGQEISVKNMEKMTEAMLWGAGINAAGNLVGDIIDVVKFKTPTKTATSTTSVDKAGNYSERHTTTTRSNR